MKKEWIIYIVILCLASFLRLYNLSFIPPGVNQDEASIGYTAYSLIKTGSDEYGRYLPLSFQSFGDWKLPLYIYITVPFVQLFGLTELAVRLPSAMFGIGTVALAYFLVQELFRSKKLSFLTMFLLAIAPWSLHLSRVESESNTAVFFVTLGMLLFLKGFKKQWLLIPASFFIALTYFTYAGNYVFTTLLVIGSLFIYKKQIPKTKIAVIAGLVFLVMSGYIGYQNVFANKTKISGIGIFGDPSIVHAQIEIPRIQHSDPNTFLLARLTHNKVVFAVERFMQNYLNAYSPQFLFISGGTNNAHNIQSFGNMYLIEAPFLILGLFVLFTRKKSNEKYLILLWFFAAPIAASLTKDAPHTNRMFSIFPILPLVVSFGFIFFYEKMQEFKIWGKAIIGFVIVVFAINLLIYIDQYFIHFPRNEVVHWGIGYKELARRIETDYKGKHIIMAHPERSNYSYLLFYTKYDPALYQKQAVRYQPTSDGFLHVKEYGDIEFREIDFGKDSKLPNAVLVSFPQDTPIDVKTNSKTTSVTLPNGDVMFYITET